MKTSCGAVQKRLGVVSVGVLACLCLFLLLGTRVQAQVSNSYTPGVDVSQYTYAKFVDWLRKDADAKVPLKPGDVFTSKDLDRLGPFIPPGYLEQLNFLEFSGTVEAAEDWAPPASYRTCSEKYQNQVKLNPDNTISNYVCGRPFAEADLKVSDPRAGTKAAWDFEYRWQNYGVTVFNLGLIWSRPGTDHSGLLPELAPTLPPENWGITPAAFNVTTKWPSEIGTSEYFGGGGTFQRVLNAAHQRVYFTHLAQLADSGGVLQVSDAKNYEFKEFTGFFTPFDIRGTAFIVFRYDDPYRADDSWSYVPNIRRVRRASAEIRSDSLLGTDNTLDDFYGFSGHEVEWNFEFLGTKDVLVPVANRDFPRLYGPEGSIPNSAWEVRRFAVVYRTPRVPRYPESCLMFWDIQSFNTAYYFNFDGTGKLWKTNLYWGEKNESIKAFAEMSRGTNMPIAVNHSIIDVQRNRGTIETFVGFGFPNVDPRQVARMTDVNRLEEVHR
ncbi:MAG: DUF1329 domain-containing protein [Candidatus Binataceae bacterium]|jgi:hypothetical protein